MSIQFFIVYEVAILFSILFLVLVGNSSCDAFMSHELQHASSTLTASLGDVSNALLCVSYFLSFTLVRMQ